MIRAATFSNYVYFFACYLRSQLTVLRPADVEPTQCCQRRGRRADVGNMHRQMAKTSTCRRICRPLANQHWTDVYCQLFATLQNICRRIFDVQPTSDQRCIDVEPTYCRPLASVDIAFSQPLADNYPAPARCLTVSAHQPVYNQCTIVTIGDISLYLLP